MAQQTNAVVVYETPQQARNDIEVLVSQRLASYLADERRRERFQAIAVRAVLGNPSLMQCTRESLLGAITTAAELGLEPSGLLGSAYIVPYNVRKNIDGTWRTVKSAQLIPGYRGLIDLARRSGEILKVEARVVRLRDEFAIDYGSAQPITHRPFVPDPSAAPEDRDPGPYVGAYMRAVLRGDPVPQVEWMTTDEIDQVRRRSKASDDGPWTTDWSEMARKTVVRRGSKYLPLTTDLTRALELDEEAERQAEPPAQPVRVSPAQQLLLDRAEAATGQPQAARQATDTAEATVVAPGAASEAVEASAPLPEPPPVHVPGGTPPIPAMDEAPATAIEECGDDGGMLGTCQRMPGHRGKHQGAGGEWPQERRR